MGKRPVDLVEARRETTEPAKEVLEHLYKALLAVPAFTLKNGSKASVERYCAPEIDEEGELHCGFDVRLENGAYLEFTVKNTGWGKSFMAESIKKPENGGHQR